MRLEGLGQVAGGIAPGSICYDPTHDPGSYHCANTTSVLNSALNPFSANLTTTCSAAEQTCLADPTNAAQVAQAGAPDVCMNNIGISCTEIAVIAAALLFGVAFVGKEL